MDIRPLILAVDDDAHILQIIKWELTSQGCQVVTCRSGEEALDIAREQRPELIILDVMMPALDGFEVLRRLRERTSVPVILLTAKTRDQDKIGGLDTGADDYVTKPFSPEELSARVKAILRRGPREDAAESTVIRNGNVEIDLGRRRIKKDGEDVILTRTEWTLLEHLASNPGKVLSISDLLTKMWSIDYVADAQYLRVWISRLRSKLGDEKPYRMIKTFTGVGYMLRPGSDDAGLSEVEEEGDDDEDQPVDISDISEPPPSPETTVGVG
jgi:two-component system KDP operon response regulator KdpE